MAKHIPTYDLFAAHYPRTGYRREHADRRAAFWHGALWASILGLWVGFVLGQWLAT